MSGRRGEYSGRVREAFEHPQHAGAPDGGHRFEGSAAEGGAGMRIRLFASTADGRWSGLRYRVFGCPHLIAAAEFACAHFEGRPVGAALEFPVEEIMTKLDIPVEKTGRILLLEDAFRALLRDAERN